MIYSLSDRQISENINVFHCSQDCNIFLHRRFSQMPYAFFQTACFGSVVFAWHFPSPLYHGTNIHLRNASFLLLSPLSPSLNRFLLIPSLRFCSSFSPTLPSPFLPSSLRLFFLFLSFFSHFFPSDPGSVPSLTLCGPTLWLRKMASFCTCSHSFYTT